MSASLTESERKLLTALRGFSDRGMLPGPGCVGADIWRTKHTKPQAYALTAGKMLNQLRARGLCSYRFSQTMYRGGWEITEAGRKALRA